MGKTPARLLGDYRTDESYEELQRVLMENPELGDVMPGIGGFRKVRWEHETETQVVR